MVFESYATGRAQADADLNFLVLEDAIDLESRTLSTHFRLSSPPQGLFYRGDNYSDVWGLLTL